MLFIFRSLRRLTVLFAAAAALEPIEVHEQQFITSTGSRFTIVGVDYQPGGSAGYGTGRGDPLSNGTTCLRDAALMQALGVNTIRSYNLDPTLNHDECASIFAAVGIYMIFDVNSPLVGQSLDRDAPWTTYTLDYLTHVFSVIEGFKSYPNTLGFFSGNEIVNDLDTGAANPPYIRAVQRDMKSYIAQHASRAIPVGYSAAQVEDFLQDSWSYLQCNNSANVGGGADLSRSDFFGLNSYSWCGNGSSYTTSGYATLESMFNASTIPVFFSEYGCNVPLPRYFDEVPVLYGPLMTALSGGLVYEFTEEGSQFGLIEANANGSATLLPDYNTLRAQLAHVNVTLLASANATATALQPPACAASLISADGFSRNFTLPAPPPGAAQLIQAGVASAPTGSLVAVTQTRVGVPVYAADGAALVGLQITPVAAAIPPGGGGANAALSAVAPSSSSASATSASVDGNGATAVTSSVATPTHSTSAAAATSVRVFSASFLLLLSQCAAAFAL